MAIIELERLTKRYDGLLAVDGLDLTVEEGEVFGLLGPNGAGKTTTLLMLTTLVKPTSGAARVNGHDIVRRPHEVRRSLGIVFQDPSSDDILTGYENLKLHGMLYGMPPALREERISEVLRLVGLEGRKNDLVKKYSGGMRRRLEIARGLMHRPKVLFLDEPTLGLDPQAREVIWEYVERLAEEGGMSIVITTHYMEEADRLCGRIAIIHSGRIVALDSPENLKKVVGGDIITIRVADPDLAALRALPFVKKVEARDGCVSLTVTAAADQLPAVLRAAGGAESVEVHRPTLNDVFIHYTGREIREGSAEGGWLQRSMNYRVRR